MVGGKRGEGDKSGAGWELGTRTGGSAASLPHTSQLLLPRPPRPAPCRPDQVKEEVMAFLRMMGEVYAIFGLDYKMALST